MDYEAAKQQLRDQAVSETGFVSSLRPYTGLDESNFHAVMHALFVVMREHPREGRLDRACVESLWLISDASRRWGTEPDGMLRRNGLISDVDLERLRDWLCIIDSTFGAFISGVDLRIAASAYAAYVAEHGAAGVPVILVEVLAGQLDLEAELGDAEAAAKALARFGADAKSALPALRRAAEREYCWAEPADRLTRRIRAAVAAAIARIEAEAPSG